MSPAAFPPELVQTVLRHMNTDHANESLVIVRAFADPSAKTVVMTGVDSDRGTWAVESENRTTEVTIPWAAPVTERAGIRREVVALYDAARAKLGLPPERH